MVVGEPFSVLHPGSSPAPDCGDWFDSQTRHHRVDHRNLKLGQRTAAWRLPNRKILRFHVCGLGYLSNPDATSGMVGMENALWSESCIYKHGPEKWTTSLEITAKCNSRTAKAVAICEPGRGICTSGPPQKTKPRIAEREISWRRPSTSNGN